MHVRNFAGDNPLAQEAVHNRVREVLQGTHIQSSPVVIPDYSAVLDLGLNLLNLPQTADTKSHALSCSLTGQTNVAQLGLYVLCKLIPMS